jgi:ferredoxin
VPVVLGATRGGFKLGPVYVPGAAGFANFMAALILVFWGYRIKGAFSLDMPVNMINLHWGLHRKNIDAISNRALRKLSIFMALILENRRLWFTLNNLWDLAWTVLIFWLIPVFPILYLLIGRIYMGKLNFSNNNCIGCGLCAKACPNEGIIMRQVGEGRKPYWTYHCETCLRCMGYCKKRAIEAGHSWAVLLYFITAIPATTWFLAWLHETFPVLPVITEYWTLTIFSILYVFPAMMISYFIYWWLIRIPFVNTFFRYTTLTRWYRRYHEPETKLKNMTGGKWRSKGSEPA